MREVARQLLDARAHQTIGLQLVGAGGELYAQGGGRHTVIAAEVVIFLRAQRHLRHVAQRHHRAVAVGAQRNRFKLFRRLQQRLRVNRGVQRLVIDRRRAADLTHRDLTVLRFNRAYHILRGERIVNQLVGIEPDTHRILGAVGVHLADAADAAEGVLNITGDIVGDILLIHTAVSRDKRQHQNIAFAGFIHRHALLLHRLWQFAQGRL